MARTIDEIYQAILAEKDNQPDLAELNSPSNTAIYKAWAYVIAVGHYILENLWDLFRQEVEDIAAAAAPGTLKWYAQKVLEYQHGDVLVFKDNVYQYDPVDESKRIVKRVSVNDGGGLVKVKAAKLSGQTVVVLSQEEIDGLTDYLEQSRFAGTALFVQSLNPDKIRMSLEVYYDAQTGLTSLKAAVEAAIVNYINTIPFDGIFLRNKLIDAVQAVEGVIDVKVVDLFAKVGTNPYVAIDRAYQAVSGYFEIDPAYPLSTNITYIT